MACPIVVDFEPRLPAHHPTPKDAMLALASRVKSHSQGETHILCDSIFTSARTLQEFEVLDVAFTVGLSNAATCGMRELFNVGSSDLPHMHARTFHSSPYVVQIIHKGDHILGVASTAWDLPASPSPPPSPILSYETAVCLLENDPASNIATAFHLPSTINVEDIVGVIQAATGQDVSLPPSFSSGEVTLDEEGMKKMKMVQLQQLHRRTPRCRGTANKSKIQLMKEIMENHPLAQVAGSSKKEKEKIASITALKDSLLGETSTDAPLTAFYSENYGLVDQVNRAYYEYLNPATHRSWRKLYLMSVLFTLLMNGWSLFNEHKFHCALRAARGRLSALADVETCSLFSFIVNLCKQIGGNGE